MEKMSNCTADNLNAATNGITPELSPNSLESRGTPIKSLILLTFVSVLFGGHNMLYLKVWQMTVPIVKELVS